MVAASPAEPQGRRPDQTSGEKLSSDAAAEEAATAGEADRWPAPVLAQLHVRLGDDALLGTLGQGRYILHKGYHNGRILISALAVGLAQGCLDHAIAYAKEREAFGRRIGGFQLVQKMVADIAVKVETARLIARKAAWAYDSGTPDDYTMSISKYYCAEIASECADLAIQVHGGSGFMNESPPSRYWRDTRIVRIGDGTSQIQVLLIAKALGLDVDFG